jgi:hypothetical protein
MPATVLVGDDVLLKALVGGASIADEDAALRLYVAARKQTGARDADEGVAWFDDLVGPLVKGERVPRGHLRGHPGGIETGEVEKVVCGVKKGKAADEGVGEAFAFQSRPGPRGIYLLEMIASAELMCEFEVVEDSKDGLGNFHEGWMLS